MIDYENEIFTDFAGEVRSKHPGITVIGEYVRKPSKFPATTLDEYRNVTVDECEDSSREEKFAGLAYRLQVFSNKQSGKKAEAKAIFATADAKMRSMGFRRKTYTTTPDLYESTVYAIKATYEATAGADGFIYKR